MKSPIQSVKGTRDFYPENMAIRTWLYSLVRKVSESFGYQEYEGPFLESLELYAAKSGEELVKEQSYVFPDRDGDLISLRPELTPTLARMVAQRQRQLVYPLRWWSFGPFWRYERPQKGRSREFFQWNIDLIGINSPEADAEIAAIIAYFFRETKLSPEYVQILVNNRQLMERELENLDIPKLDRSQIFRLIDRRSKLTDSAWEDFAGQIGLNNFQIDGIINLLTDYELWKKSHSLIQFFHAAEALKIMDYVRFDPSIIRGLDYYTGTVFEAVEVEGDIRRSILGGGRYDNLMEAVGGDPLPAVGFAMGDIVVSLLLEKHKLLPDQIDTKPPIIFVTIFDRSLLEESLSLSSDLRLNGFNVICYHEVEKLSKQLKFANRINASVTLILGEEEVNNELVAIKDMQSGEQQSIPKADAAEAIRQILASQKRS